MGVSNFNFNAFLMIDCISILLNFLIFLITIEFPLIQPLAAMEKLFQW